MFSSSVGGSIDSSGSALRFGLMDIRPIEVKEIVKRFGLKFRRISRGFESLTPSESFTDLVKFENETIFNTIEIPKWFDANELVKRFSQRIIDAYEKDTEMKNAVEEVRKSRRKGKPLLSFIIFFKKRFESKRDYYLESEAERFLRSNFPLSFYNKLVVFDNTFYKYLEVIEEIVRWHEFRASASRNFLMYDRVIKQMQKKLSPIIDEIDRCCLSYFRLKKFVAIWNSKDYDEIFNPKFLDFNNIKSSEFEDLYNDFNSKLIESRRFLLHYNSEIFLKELDSDKSTIKLFGRLVLFPSSSLSLEG